MSEYDKPLRKGKPMELRETPDLDLPVPTEPLRSWRGTVDPVASLAFSETQLARYWNDPEFVRRRREERVSVPFKL